MKLKYYLRGLGIGILVTAVIMGVTQGSRKETLSDREIRERAAALGMVEPGNSLADLEAAETPAATEIPEAIETPAATETPEAAETPAATEAPAATPEVTARPTQKPAEEEEGSSYTFEIQAGDSSYQVAYRLQQAGLVADARDFDNYLCSKGYDRKLKTGSYEIPETATEEEISEILCGR
jgi:septal ring-binding cell division protein DamX